MAKDVGIPQEVLRIPGLHAAAEIRVDRCGVPPIYAGSEADLFLVQGFSAARDRLFQIDLWRRRGLGQLSEVFGPGFLEQDRAARLESRLGITEPSNWSRSANVMLAGLETPDGRFGENAVAKRDQLLLSTLKSAWEEMERLQGPEPAFWQWGKLQFNLNEHPFAPIADDPMHVRINAGPIAKNGSEFTPNQSLTRDTDFRQMNGPSVRIVLDVGNWDNSRAVNHPGQSGDPREPTLLQPRAALE